METNQRAFLVRSSGACLHITDRAERLGMSASKVETWCQSSPHTEPYHAVLTSHKAILVYG